MSPSQSHTTARNRYPGVRPYVETEADCFFGRTLEVEELFHAVHVNNVLVLHGESGLGKSSVLNAGLIPLLIQKSFYPFSITFRDKNLSPLENIIICLKDKLDADNIPYGESPNHETALVDLVGAASKKGMPVLLFDQFEEFHQFPYEQRQAVIKHLSALVTPGSNSAGELPYVRIMFSLRSDRLEILEEFKDAMPGILSNRVILKPIVPTQAHQIITRPSILDDFQQTRFFCKPFKMEKELVDCVVDVVTTHNAIDSTKIQMICQEIESFVREKQKQGSRAVVTVRLDDLNGRQGLLDLVKNFYQKQLDKLGKTELESAEVNAVRKALEEEFIIDAIRVKVNDRAFDQYLRQKKVKVDRIPAVKRAVLDLRLLRATQFGNETFLEVGHDSMVASILERKKVNDENASRRRTGFVVSGLVAAVILVGLAAFFVKQRNDTLEAVLIMLFKANAKEARRTVNDGMAFWYYKAAAEHGVAEAKDALNSFIFAPVSGQEVLVNPDNVHFISKYGDSKWDLWNWSDVKPVRLDSSGERATSEDQVIFSTLGKFAAIGTGRRLKLIDLKKKGSVGSNQTAKVFFELDSVNVFTVSPKDTYLAVADTITDISRCRIYALDSTIDWNVGNINKVNERMSRANKVGKDEMRNRYRAPQLSFSFDERLVGFTGPYDSAFLFDLNSRDPGEPITELGVTGILFDDKLPYVVFSKWEETVVWRWDTGTLKRKAFNSPPYINDESQTYYYSYKENRNINMAEEFGQSLMIYNNNFVTGATDERDLYKGTIFNLETGVESPPILDPYTLSPSGDTLLVCHADGTVDIYETGNFTRIETYPVFSDSGYCYPIAVQNGFLVVNKNDVNYLYNIATRDKPQELDSRVSGFYKLTSGFLHCEITYENDYYYRHAILNNKILAMQADSTTAYLKYLSDLLIALKPPETDY